MKSLIWTVIFALAIASLVCIDCAAESSDGNKSATAENDPYPSALDSRYIIFFLTNTSVDQAGSMNAGKDADTNYNFVAELPQIFGSMKSDSKYKYAFGLTGPMLLTQSVQEMQYQINKAFDLAEQYDVPVYFQLDDCNNYTTEFGGGANPKYYDNPDWCEWVAFPGAGETWGGQSNGRLPYFWFNWGSWMHADPFPCFQTPGFRQFVAGQLEDGVLGPLKARYDSLCLKGKDYLFAGVAIGWETHIPDYSPANTILNIQLDNLPVNILQGDRMESWEAVRYGYNALRQKGCTAFDLDTLYHVIHDYSEFLAKKVYDAGIPKHKIFSHIVGNMVYDRNMATTFAPPLWVAVNDYCIPGFTLTPRMGRKDMGNLKADIGAADPNQPYFAVAEGYSIGVEDDYPKANEYFDSVFKNGAVVVSVFGWGREADDSSFAVSHSINSPFVKAAKRWLDMK